MPPPQQHGLLFSAPMAFARHTRKKWHTRRAIAKHNSRCDGGPVPDGLPHLHSPHVTVHVESHGLICVDLAADSAWTITPRIQPGHTIWWKETWTPNESDGGPVIQYRAGGTMMHCATGDKRLGTWRDYVVPGDPGTVYEVERWRSSMLMPRWAARFADPVINVRAERLLSITDADALAEGIRGSSKDGGITVKYGIPDRDGWPGNDDHGWPWHEWCNTPRQAFLKLWAKINGQASVDANPWLWVYEMDINATPLMP